MLKWVSGAVGLVEFGGELDIVPERLTSWLCESIAQIEAVGGIHMDGLKQGDPVECRFC